MIVIRLDLPLKEENDLQTGMGRTVVERELNIKISGDSKKASMRFSILD